MKTTIKILVVCAIVTGINFNSFAQQERKGPPPIEERVNHVIRKISKKIELTDIQKETVKLSFTTFFETVDELMKSDERPERSVIEGFEKQRDNEIKVVLSEEQYEDYLRMTCYLRPHPHPKHKRERPPSQN